MARNALLVRLLAAVGAIAAIALAAATLETPIESGGNGGSGTGDGAPSVDPPPTAQPHPSDAEIPAFLEYLVAVVAILAAIAFVWYLLAHRRDALRVIAVALCFALVVAVGIVLVQDNLPAAEPPPPPEQPNSTSGGGDGGTGSGEGSSISTGPVLLVLSIITAIFIGGLLVSRNGGESDDANADRVDAEPVEQPDTAAIGSAAGRAADRIDDEDGADVDNEIYRAWREMTDLLEVDRPESSTPREFAGAAVDAGLEREDVDELTRLFEDVRYGGAETTAEMETRALEVLRRIETEYAAAEADSSDAGSNDANSNDAGSNDADSSNADNAGTHGGDEQ